MLSDRLSVPERVLWLAVLYQAVVDATCTKPTKKDDFDKNPYKYNARSWVGGRSFLEVCFLSGLDPRYVERVIRGHWHQGTMPMMPKHFL